MADRSIWKQFNLFSFHPLSRHAFHLSGGEGKFIIIIIIIIIIIVVVVVIIIIIIIIIIIFIIIKLFITECLFLNNYFKTYFKY